MVDKEKIRIAIQMVDEMLVLAEEQDTRHRANAIAKGKGEEAIGTSWEIFHLRALKELLEDVSL